MLGGKCHLNGPDEVKQELERLGHHEFMSFSGINVTGQYEPLDVHLKLMYCRALKYPLLLEIEKVAETVEEVKRCNDEIMAFISRHDIADRLVQKEPPTLLYESIISTHQEKQENLNFP